jgi:DNA end-binding protein Ku
MARAIWSGALSFGLVNVPVALFAATKDHEVHFHQFEKGTSARVRNKRVNEDTGKEVAYDDIVKGAEIRDGEYVIVTPEELESVEPGKSRTIDISDFVDAAEIDPLYYQRGYYLGPQDETAGKAYALLVKAMDAADRIGIATFVMRGKQYLAAIRPKDDVLVLETMYFADEVRDPVEAIGQKPPKVTLRKKDIDMAVSLIESMTTSWKPENYTDTYTERVNRLIEAKGKDEEIVTEAERAPASNVVDLMQALQASLEAARGQRPGNRRQAEQKIETRKATARTPAKKAAAKKAAAKKAAAKKSPGRKAPAKKAATPRPKKAS